MLPSSAPSSWLFFEHLCKGQALQQGSVGSPGEIGETTMMLHDDRETTLRGTRRTSRRKTLSMRLCEQGFSNGGSRPISVSQFTSKDHDNEKISEWTVGLFKSWRQGRNIIEILAPAVMIKVPKYSQQQ